MSKTAHPEMLEAIKAYCARYNLTETRFGKLALKDPSFIAQLKNGRECRQATRDAVYNVLRKPPKV